MHRCATSMHVHLHIAILYNIISQHTGNSRAECPYSWGRGVPHSGGYPSLSETAASGCTHDKDKCCQENYFGIFGYFLWYVFGYIHSIHGYPSLLEMNLLTIAMIKTNAAKKTIFGFLSKDFTFEHLFAILNAGFISRFPLSCILEMTFLIYALRKCLCQI